MKEVHCHEKLLWSGWTMFERQSLKPSQTVHSCWVSLHDYKRSFLLIKPWKQVIAAFYRPQGKVMFSEACNSHSVHNRPHGYWFTAHSCYGAVGTHPTSYKMTERHLPTHSPRVFLKHKDSLIVWNIRPPVWYGLTTSLHGIVILF